MIDLKKMAEYYPLESSRNTKDAIGRVRWWLDALENEPDHQFSRWQVAEDLIELARLVMYDDAKRLGRMDLAEELLDEQKIKARAKNKQRRPKRRCSVCGSTDPNCDMSHK